jgi:aminoglycoside 6'-N-acetyltransferase I
MKPDEWREWARLRGKLFEISFEDARVDCERFVAGTDPNIKLVILAFDGDRAIGFAEVSERSYADGCYDGPVAFLEGWAVDEAYHKKGIGRAIVDAVVDRAKANNYPHLASDADITNITSQKAHGALGFEEVGRIVQFRMKLK